MKLTQQNYSYWMKLLQLGAIIVFAATFFFLSAKGYAHVDLLDPTMGVDRLVEDLRGHRGDHEKRLDRIYADRDDEAQREFDRGFEQDTLHWN